MMDQDCLSMVLKLLITGVLMEEQPYQVMPVSTKDGIKLKLLTSNGEEVQIFQFTIMVQIHHKDKMFY